MKKRILAFRNCWAGLGPRGTDLIGGVGYYRIQKPMQYLREKYDVFEFGDLISTQKRLQNAGVTWDFENMVPNLIRDCDIVLMKNISHPGGLAWFVGAAKHYDKPLLVDMDDNYMAVDDLHPKRKYFNETSEAQITHKLLFSSATAITVSTEPLKKVYEEFNPHVHVLPNCNDINDWPHQKAKRSDGRIVIGWAGSQTHEADFKVIEPVINALWKLYGKKIIFAICGGLPEKLVKNLPQESYVVYSGTRTMRDYHARLASWGFDIGLAPLKDSVFNEGKGHGKWMEYAMYQIPLVASNVGPYSRHVDNGRTGLLVKTTEEWVGAISRLIEDEKECERIGQNAYNEVRDLWQWKQHISKWEEVLETYIDKGYAK